MEMVKGGGFLGCGEYQDGRSTQHPNSECASGISYTAHKSFKIFAISINTWDEEVCIAGTR